MRGTGIGTSLILIATGAVLAFAVNYQVTGVSISAVGAILLIVGIIGLMLSVMMNGEMFGTSTSSHTTVIRDEPTDTVGHTHPTNTVMR